MLILEFGSCSLKIGSSGDVEPKVFYYSLDNDAISDWRESGWGPLQMNYRVLYDYPPVKDQLISVLNATLNRCWDELCCNDQEMLLVEYPFLPVIVKESIHQVLLKKFAKEISILPTPISSVLSFGSTLGLVIDLGYLDSRVYLVYDGRVLENCTGFYPIGGKMITNVIKNFLLENGTWKISGIENAISQTWLDSVPLMVWESLKSKIFESNYSTFQLNSCQSFTFPENLLDFVLEKIFEKDSDNCNIVTVIGNVLEKCPIDLRKSIAKNIFLTGGCGNISRLSKRLISELTTHCQESKKLQHLSLEFGNSSFSPMMASWTGASVYSSLKGVSLVEKIRSNQD